jgi:predicted NUDIX family NTP pyrophosphohydrolase
VTAVSAGVLLYRRGPRGIEVLIAHPGGPYFASKQEGAWSVPKGLVEPDEGLEPAARREWEEETGLELPGGAWLDLGETVLRSGKRVRVWGVPGEADPTELDGNTFELEWPPRSGQTRTFPEIDEVRWCPPAEAQMLLNSAQAVFVDRLLKILGESADE